MVLGEILAEMISHVILDPRKMSSFGNHARLHAELPKFCCLLTKVCWSAHLLACSHDILGRYLSVSIWNVAPLIWSQKTCQALKIAQSSRTLIWKEASCSNHKPWIFSVPRYVFPNLLRRHRWLQSWSEKNKQRGYSGPAHPIGHWRHSDKPV